MTDAYGFYLGQPWWLCASLVVVPLVWLARRNLAALGRGRRIAAVTLRVLVVLLLAILLARPTLVQTSRRTTVIAVLDRSESIPANLADAALEYLSKAVTSKEGDDRLAAVDVAEAATISMLPSTEAKMHRRNTTLTGQQSRLAAGIEMAMAIASPDSATRILLVSEGNETEGDLKEAARTAGANKIPIDVLPLEYRYKSEVLFKRLVAPPQARSGQAVSLRFILSSTADIAGRLLLTLNDEPVDLVLDLPEMAVPVELKEGTNVKTLSIPLGTRGMNKFEAAFMPDDPKQDRIVENNRASAVTFVVGPGHVSVFDVEGSGADLAVALQRAGIDVIRKDVAELPSELPRLLDMDAIVLVNTPVQCFTMAQQEMLCRYVNDLGGGLVMVGGPESFGAGGWIDSPVAAILPVELDPPQKRQLPLGALVLVIDHSGSMAGEKVEICKAAAAGAVRLLGRRDLVGIVVFEAVSEWLVPLGPAEDKAAIRDKIATVGAGGGTIMKPAMENAFDALQKVPTSVRHVILLTDGQTDEREACARLGTDMGTAGITISTVAVGKQADTQLLHDIAQSTKGRFYPVTDITSIPEIFIKEAQVVRRSMIVEETVSPRVVNALSEIVGGIVQPLPALDGYVLTGPKSGLNQVVLTGRESDPILATCQAGLGRCVAFTSSADSRWAGQWLAWSDFARFWEQVIRWAGKPAQSTDCEIFTDVEGQQATVNVEAFGADGKFLQLAAVEGQVLTPEMKGEPLQLSQTGPGQYSGRFRTLMSGSYIVNLQYRKTGPEEKPRLANAIVSVPFAPEFRDLTDNAPLLEEVSRMTGGRVLSLDSDPNKVNLYEHAGLEFPQTHLPLVKPLMLAWIVIFLLDVAVRRVILDVRAGLRRVKSWVLSTAKREQDQTIARLQARRQKLRAQWSSRTADEILSRHYEGAEKYQGELLTNEPKRETEPPVKPQMQEPSKPEPPQGGTHIDQLLKAKRKKAGQDENE
ncbi:MAG: VWA domain-containing protein [Sedimentisphaerales bacterium]|nr:VWA domain-containing protein [Sedimentisphaerales bacterium]